MIEDLKINNANLELNFDKYTYEYTVTCDEDVYRLDFDYKVSEGTVVNIRNNNLEDYENIVYLDVYDIDTEYTYTFYVYRGNNDQNVLGIENYFASLETVKNEEVPEYQVQLLCISVFFIIIILFSIMFRRKKKKAVN